jgi:hypothetical protein
MTLNILSALRNSLTLIFNSLTPNQIQMSGKEANRLSEAAVGTFDRVSPLFLKTMSIQSSILVLTGLTLVLVIWISTIK